MFHFFLDGSLPKVGPRLPIHTQRLCDRLGKDDPILVSAFPISSLDLLNNPVAFLEDTTSPPAERWFFKDLVGKRVLCDLDKVGLLQVS